MRPFHGPVLMLLLVLLLAAAFCKHSAWPVVPGPNIHRNRRILLKVVKDKVRFPRANPELLTSYSRKKQDLPSEQKAQNNKSHHIVEVFPRDLRQKEKFLKHLTGPLYFNPRCRKHFYRLYHNTRDCKIPAYYKRCARLLTRLAGSPRCTER